MKKIGIYQSLCVLLGIGFFCSLIVLAKKQQELTQYQEATMNSSLPEYKGITSFINEFLPKLEELDSTTIDEYYEVLSAHGYYVAKRNSFEVTAREELKNKGNH